MKLTKSVVWPEWKRQIERGMAPIQYKFEVDYVEPETKLRRYATRAAFFYHPISDCVQVPGKFYTFKGEKIPVYMRRCDV